MTEPTPHAKHAVTAIERAREVLAEIEAGDKAYEKWKATGPPGECSGPCPERDWPSLAGQLEVTLQNVLGEIRGSQVSAPEGEDEDEPYCRTCGEPCGIFRG